MLRPYILLVLLCLSFDAGAQLKKDSTLFITKDSMPYALERNAWRYHDGDNMAYAGPDYNDSTWRRQKTWFDLNSKKAPPFSGIAWFRLHFLADSSVTTQQLGLLVDNPGAMELYLDGRLLHRFGRVSAARDSTVYYNPRRMPFTFQVRDPGPHVMAVRYANYDAPRNISRYDEHRTGFRFTLADGNLLIAGGFRQVLAWAVLFIFFAAIFFTLALLHFLLFLYHRSDKANLWFSVFSLFMSLFFFSYLIILTAHSPGVYHCFLDAIVPFALGACCTMSGVVNTLFTRKRLSFYIILAFGAVATVLYFFYHDLGLVLLLFLVSVVAIEAIVVLIAAMRRKVKGASVVGAGFLIFALFTLFLYVLAFLTRVTWI